MESPNHLEFLTWCAENNITHHPDISLHKFPTMGWGFKANKDIKAGETVIKVPAVCQLSFPNSNFKREVADKISLDNYDFNILALSLMFELSKADSFFRLYLSILPSVDSILFWNASELVELENTCLEGLDHDEITIEYNERIAPFVKNWASTTSTTTTTPTSSKPPTISTISTTTKPSKSSKLPKNSKNSTTTSSSLPFNTSTPTLDKYKTALGIVLSRAFQVEDGVPYLCPLIDMMNAKVDSPNIEVGTITNTENSSVVLIAKASMKIHEGDQLFITYGAFSNSELIRKYGYIEKDNKYNEVHIDMEAVCEVCGEVFGELADDRQAFIEGDAIILRRDATHGAATFLDDVRRVAELHMLQDEDFELLQELVASDGSEAAWRRFHEESGGMADKQVRGIALLVLGRKLSDYATSLEEDEAWLRDNVENSRKRLAVELRVSEKIILMDWMKHIKGETQATTPRAKATKKTKAKETKKRKMA